MMKEKQTSRGNSVGGSTRGDKPPKVNWLQHANAHDNFSTQKKFLSSNFLYSLSTQKPCTEASTSSRLMACQVLNLQRVPTTQVEKVARGQNEGYTSTHNSFHARATNGISSNHMAHTSQAKGPGGSPDFMDDDDILENIDVDQIVTEHFQSTCTPQPSISKFPPITPTVGKNNVARDGETCLPAELCLNCNHGSMLGLCPEASNHLQDMKDRLISISNELLDNVVDLSSDQIEKLRQDRCDSPHISGFCFSH
ncbi:DNA helicase [Sarracenia purpurea var. burkii]